MITGDKMVLKQYAPNEIVPEGAIFLAISGRVVQDEYAVAFFLIPYKDEPNADA